MDDFQPLDITKLAIDALVNKGYAVYRIEKFNMGDNLGMSLCDTSGYHEELKMYKAGYEHLLKINDIEQNKIYLFGHSMGGTTAPLLAQLYQPKGIIVYGTGFKPWSEYLVDAYRLQPSYYGEDQGDLRAKSEAFKPYLNDFFYSDKSIIEITKDPLGMEAMQEILNYNPLNQSGHSGRHIKTFKELNQVNVAKALSKYQNHVLAIYGESDIAAINPDDTRAMIDHVNREHPDKGSFWLAPRSIHNFEDIGTMSEYIEWQKKPQEYLAYASQRFNSKIFDYIDQWIEGIKD